MAFSVMGSLLKNLLAIFQLSSFYTFQDLRRTDGKSDRRTDGYWCFSRIYNLYSVGNTSFYLLHTFRRI